MGRISFGLTRGICYGISGKTGGASKGWGYDPDRGIQIGKQFHYGNDTGAKDRIDILDGNLGDLSPLPANKNDNYMHYYVGFSNGAMAEENQDKSINTTNHGHYVSGCPSDKTDEYCAGFKAGWNYNLNDNS